MKTLRDVKQDMSDLYESVRAGETDLRVAAELTNIMGKLLKAEALEFAKTVFSARLQMGLPTAVGLIENASDD